MTIDRGHVCRNRLRITAKSSENNQGQTAGKSENSQIVLRLREIVVDSRIVLNRASDPRKSLATERTGAKYGRVAHVACYGANISRFKRIIRAHLLTYRVTIAATVMRCSRTGRGSTGQQHRGRSTGGRPEDGPSQPCSRAASNLHPECDQAVTMPCSPPDSLIAVSKGATPLHP